jgi:hypothetical protein
MISARGPDSASADEPGIDVRAPLLRVARQTTRPLHPTPCRPASAEASNRAVGPASNPFPSGLLPSGLGMAKPTIPQARDRAEVLWGRYTPGMGYERRFPGTSGNGHPKRARECLLKVASADRALARRTSGTGRGRVKTPTFNQRIEIPSRFRQFENQKCLRLLLGEDDRENNSAHFWRVHVFTQPGSISAARMPMIGWLLLHLCDV